MKRALQIAVTMCLLAGFTTACEKGPAEKLGEKIDNAVQGNPGPAERTGEKLDKAVQSTKDAVEDAKDAVTKP